MTQDLSYWKTRCECAEATLLFLMKEINNMDPTLEGALYTLADLRAIANLTHSKGEE